MLDLEKTSALIVNELKEMYRRSTAEEYYTFRTFMMGTRGTQMFPKGVKYEGVSDDYL
jgi:indoleamine 2,3-dioxygenase